MKDVTIIIPQAGGAVPQVWASLGSAGINVEAALSFAREHHRVVHVVVEDEVSDQTVEVLEGAGFMVVDKREVLVVPLPDQPGALADVTRKAEAANAEVYLLSMATGDRVLLGCVNLESARAAFDM